MVWQKIEMLTRGIRE